MPTANFPAVADLARAIESIAPVHLAQPWDNVGLLAGDPGKALSGPVLLTVDLTEAVVDEAIVGKCAAVIAYHPPIFSALKRIVGGPGAPMPQRVLHKAIEHGLAIYSPHTALDAAQGGMTDWLADGMLGVPAPGEGEHVASHRHSNKAGGDRRAFSPLAHPQITREIKIVTFVPEGDLERVRGALASAGAGIIGEYEMCSFASTGQGTFMGKAGSRPAIGKAGHFETVHERRLEMVCSRKALPLALETLRQLHPYEEPAVDIYPLESQPERGVGLGRRITLDHGATLRELAERLKAHLGVSAVQVAAASGVDLDRERFDRIGVLPGAGGSIASVALADGCQVFVTGEMKHHEVLAMVGAGMCVILGGHTATERGYLPVLAARLRAGLPGVAFTVSRADRDPIVLA